MPRYAVRLRHTLLEVATVYVDTDSAERAATLALIDAEQNGADWMFVEILDEARVIAVDKTSRRK